MVINKPENIAILRDGRWIQIYPITFLPYFLKEAGLCNSTSEARRLMQQGGVRVDGIQIFSIDDSDNLIADGSILTIGKRKGVIVKYDKSI